MPKQDRLNLSAISKAGNIEKSTLKKLHRALSKHNKGRSIKKARFIELFGDELPAEDAIELFNMLDYDKSGTLDSKEVLIMAALKRNNTKSSKVDNIMLMYTLSDRNDDGNMDMKEFFHLFTLYRILSGRNDAKNMRDEIEEIFHKMDIDGDGHVSKSEFLKFLSNNPHAFDLPCHRHPHA